MQTYGQWANGSTPLKLLRLDDIKSSSYHYQKPLPLTIIAVINLCTAQNVVAISPFVLVILGTSLNTILVITLL